jgi:spore coat protein A
MAKSRREDFKTRELRSALSRGIMPARKVCEATVKYGILYGIGGALLGFLPFLAMGVPDGPPEFDAHLSNKVFQRFVDELPIPPVIRPAPGQTDITITASQFMGKIHRDLPTQPLWGYDGSSPGPTIEVESGQLLRVHWKDNLPTKHIFPEPAGMEMDADPSMPDVRMVTHLHGAVVSESDITDRLHDSDGWPDAWITPGQEQIAEYPNPVTARTLWYHDHAMGETGRNVAAGLAGMYIIHDDYERSLNLPSGKYDVPLLIRSHALGANSTLIYTSNIGDEYYGNSISVNGKLWPYMNVEPRKYRFRFVNGSNARTYLMKLVDQADQSAGPAFYQIGSDSGFLQDTAVLNDPTDPDSPRLSLMPAERADVIVDFSKVAGHTFILMNNHLDPGDGEIKIPQMMMFKVGTTVSEPDTSSLPMHMKTIERMDPSSAVKTRQIVLNQVNMPDGTPMLQMNGKAWHDPIEEKPVRGTTEVWELVNALSDEHPFHIHLVQFQVLDRRPFDPDKYASTGQVVYTGPAEPPAPNEMGWKDTVRTQSYAVTRIIIRFEPFSGYYVYHCHILEHEDMDMMRPFQIVDPGVDTDGE